MIYGTNTNVRHGIVKGRYGVRQVSGGGSDIPLSSIGFRDLGPAGSEHAMELTGLHSVEVVGCRFIGLDLFGDPLISVSTNTGDISYNRMQLSETSVSTALRNDYLHGSTVSHNTLDSATPLALPLPFLMNARFGEIPTRTHLRRRHSWYVQPQFSTAAAPFHAHGANCLREKPGLK